MKKIMLFSIKRAVNSAINSTPPPGIPGFTISCTTAFVMLMICDSKLLLKSKRVREGMARDYTGGSLLPKRKK